MNDPQRHLDAALGYFALGMHQDAWDELESLPPAHRADDTVLELRIQIYQGLGKWESARILAESLATLTGKSELVDPVGVLPAEGKVSGGGPCSVAAGGYGSSKCGSDSLQSGLLRVRLGTNGIGPQALGCRILDGFGAQADSADDLDLDPIFGENSLLHPPPFVPPHLPESEHHD